jgi:hypothetical protein
MMTEETTLTSMTRRVTAIFVSLEKFRDLATRIVSFVPSDMLPINHPWIPTRVMSLLNVESVRLGHTAPMLSAKSAVLANISPKMVKVFACHAFREK